MMDSLSRQWKVIEDKKKRMKVLLETIDKTLDRIQTKKQMKDDELYDGFSKEEAEAYAKEAKKRWGHTETYRQSVGKYDRLTNEEKKMMQKKADQLMQDIVDTMAKGVHHEDVQRLIAHHYDNLRFFYEPNTDMYRNMGIIYVEDKRFAAYFEKYHSDLPEFMRDAMAVYCDTKESKLSK